MTTHDDICPWPEGEPIHLDPHLLTTEEKEYLGRQLAYGKVKVPALQKKFNIKAQTLYSYKRKVKKQLRICESGGRPKSLSDDAVQTLRTMLQENTSITETELRAKIRQLHHQCWRETYPEAKANTYERMSRRSVVRYSEWLRQEAARPLTDDDEAPPGPKSGELDHSKS